MKSIIGITLGDISGIGPEVIVKALADEKVFQKCVPLVIGSGFVLQEELITLKSLFSLNQITDLRSLNFTSKIINLFDPLPNIKLRPKKGKLSVRAAKAAMFYVKTATQLALNHKIAAIVTAPLNKAGINKAGFDFCGHTDYLAYLTGTKEYAMMFVHKQTRVLLVTIHVPLSAVSKLIDCQKVYIKIKQAYEAARVFGIVNPVIGVSGLNPHAGENGKFGNEEKDYIFPAIMQARRENIKVVGPIPPDTLFYRGVKKKEFDVLVCMYHDQALNPFKLLAFDKGVNLTVGLPFIRTSPDHGTAYDIASKRIADSASMKEAILIAAKLAKKRGDLSFLEVKRKGVKFL